jgi:hypothetical protein
VTLKPDWHKGHWRKASALQALDRLQVSVFILFFYRKLYFFIHSLGVCV